MFKWKKECENKISPAPKSRIPEILNGSGLTVSRSGQLSHACTSVLCNDFEIRLALFWSFRISMLILKFEKIASAIWHNWTILHTESLVPAQGNWAMHSGAFGWVPKTHVKKLPRQSNFFVVLRRHNPTSQINWKAKPSETIWMTKKCVQKKCISVVPQPDRKKLPRGYIIVFVLFILLLR